jgi:hypothetical protein
MQMRALTVAFLVVMGLGMLLPVQANALAAIAYAISNCASCLR